MQLNIEFRSEEQRKYYFNTARNLCFSGGFNNGKSYIACLQAFTWLSTFPKYRHLFARQTFADLRKTTMATFFKICPESFIETHDEKSGLTQLKNGSTILWMHLDAFDEKSLRGLEINSATIDQAEEIREEIYLVLDSRIGRWDQAIVPDELLNEYQNKHGKPWPTTPLGKHVVPNKMRILVNPDTYYHWVYRMYHPDSTERNPKYEYIEAPTNESLGDPETIAQMKGRDPEWVAKYFKGEWGASPAQIHFLSPASLLKYDEAFLKLLLSKAALFRSMDHGDSSPTCVLWTGAYKGVYVFYREYYSPNQTISEHRKAISDLSLDESYSASYADPSIFHRAAQKNGGFWSVADEYLTSDIPGPTIAWLPADNNEFATRNRINELLKPSSLYKHPITGESPAPGIYFIERSTEYPNGCFYAQRQLQAQRREYLGSDNGKSLYSDDRQEGVADHAYDPIRYFVAMHGAQPREVKKKPPVNSMAYYNELMRRRKTNTALA